MSKILRGQGQEQEQKEEQEAIIISVLTLLILATVKKSTLSPLLKSCMYLQVSVFSVLHKVLYFLCVVLFYSYVLCFILSYLKV